MKTALRRIARTGVVCTTDQVLRELLHRTTSPDVVAHSLQEQRRPG
ncbi:hypothetical protein ABT040_23335 [Streptomyces sp. NPDC002688]